MMRFKLALTYVGETLYIKCEIYILVLNFVEGQAYKPFAHILILTET